MRCAPAHPRFQDAFWARSNIHKQYELTKQGVSYSQRGRGGSDRNREPNETEKNYFETSHGDYNSKCGFKTLSQATRVLPGRMFSLRGASKALFWRLRPAPWQKRGARLEHLIVLSRDQAHSDQDSELTWSTPDEQKARTRAEAGGDVRQQTACSFAMVASK